MASLSATFFWPLPCRFWPAAPFTWSPRSAAAAPRWAVWTFPIWLYVSITGVVIYVMLYHLYPAGRVYDKINTITSVMPGELAK